MISHNKKERETPKMDESENFSNEPDWALSAMRQRLARAEVKTEVLERDNATNRERIHEISNIVQRLQGEIATRDKTIERLMHVSDELVMKQSSVQTSIDTHIKGCREDNAEARQERLNFRREARRWFVSILTTALTIGIGYLLTQYKLPAL